MPNIDPNHIDEAIAHEILREGLYYDGACDVCGYGCSIEPDADYDCPECGEGRLTSPLVTWGLI